MNHATASYILIFFIFILILILIIWEYLDHDCIHGKNCKYKSTNISPSDTKEEVIMKIKEQLRQSNECILWRRALLVGLIAVVPIIYYLKCRLPTFLEAFIIILFIFVITYFVLSWFYAHYYQPTIERLIEYLKVLEGKK